MSEPESNARVEDVLASIRRLVAQGNRRQDGREAPSDHDVSGTTAARSGPSARTGTTDTLVLTPSLRVSPEPSSEAWRETVPTAELDAGTADRTPILRLDESVRLRDESEAPRAEGADTTTAPAQPTNPDRGPDDDETVPADEAVKLDAEPVSDTQRFRERRGRKPSADSALEAKIAALEAAIARTDDDWEPDGSVGDAYAGRTSNRMDWENPARALARDEPYRLEPAARRDVPQLREAAAAGKVAAPADLVDEEMLREIVAGIVRQELQGDLGERITRNVRKLVRREILRALESRDSE